MSDGRTDPFAAADDEALAVQRGMWIHATSPRPPVGPTPHEIVFRQDKLSVRHYPARGGSVRQTPVLLVPSMINRAYILDLEPDRSLVAALSAAGHPVYLLDWGIPGPEDAGEDVGYVLLELLHRVVDRVCRHARAPRTAMLGYCQGGTLAAMYTALRPDRIAGLVALNAPVRFSEGGRSRRFVEEQFVDVDAALDPDGLLPIEVMKAAFSLLDPMGHWQKYLAVDKAASDPVALRRVLARERWLEENVPMPGAFAREFIRRAYQQDALLDGTWTIRGELVDLGRIRCPLLVVACEHDFITPPAAALPLAEAVGSERVRVELLPTGHIGVVVGSAGPRVFYPLLDHWLSEVSP